ISTARFYLRSGRRYRRWNFGRNRRRHVAPKNRERSVAESFPQDRRCGGTLITADWSARQPDRRSVIFSNSDGCSGATFTKLAGIPWMIPSRMRAKVRLQRPPVSPPQEGEEVRGAASSRETAKKMIGIRRTMHLAIAALTLLFSLWPSQLPAQPRATELGLAS